MTDIKDRNKLKLELSVLLWFAKRKIKKENGTTLEEMKDDLNNCGNPIISELWREIKDAAEKIEEGY